MNINVPILIAMIAYMAVVVAIGVIYGKKNNTSEDYFLGGRGLGPWVTAMSAEASDMSSWLLMGLPGLAFATGFGSAGWTAIGLIIGTYLNWKIVAKRLRTYTEVCDNSITIPDFFSNRYRDKKQILMTISSLMILIFFTIYTASGFAACGTLFNSVFHLPYLPSMIVCGLVIIVYTSVGGFLAASTTDLIQGLIMSFAIVLVLVVGVFKVGSISAIVENGQALDGYFSIMKYHDSATGQAVSQGFVPILSGLAWGLGYFGVPHVLVRFMAIKDSNELKKSRNIAMIWVFISLSIAVLIGFVGCALYRNVPELAGANQQRIFIYMTTHLFKGLIPSFFAGIILSGILAATMSTSDSQLLIASSCISKNIFKGLLNKEAADKQVLIISRVTTVVIAILSMIIARDENSSVFGLVQYAWAGFGGAFGPLILFSLFWKKTNLKGAVAGMLSGGIIAIGLPLLKTSGILTLHGIWNVYELLPAFLVSSLLIIVVSLATGGPSKEIEKEFDQVNRIMNEP